MSEAGFQKFVEILRNGDAEAVDRLLSAFDLFLSRATSTGCSRPNVRLFAGILRHRVPWIQEANWAAVIQKAKDAVMIEEVQIK